MYGYTPDSPQTMIENHAVLEMDSRKSGTKLEARYHVDVVPSVSYPVWREMLAECLGTLVLVLCGCGVVAQATLNKGAVGSAFLSINIGWALGIACAVMIAGPISGGHLNPAVSLALAVFGKFSWRRVPGYVASQLLGGFLGAALVYTIYWPAINEFDEGVRTVLGPTGTGGIFANYPHPSAPAYASFISEMITTIFLMVGILVLTNPKYKLPVWGIALGAGVVVGSIGLSIGFMTGYSMNPARDLGPRFFCALVGYGFEPFKAANFFAWIPTVAPIVGALVGTFLYDIILDPTPKF